MSTISVTLVTLHVNVIQKCLIKLTENCGAYFFKSIDYINV